MPIDTDTQLERPTEVWPPYYGRHRNSNEDTTYELDPTRLALAGIVAPLPARAPTAALVGLAGIAGQVPAHLRKLARALRSLRGA